MTLKKRHIIKIPNNIKVIYHNKKNILTFIGPLSFKSIKLKLKIKIFRTKKIIYITDNFVKNYKRSRLNRIIKSTKGTLKAIIKQKLIETYSLINHRLKVVGVGYKIIPKEIGKNKILQLKLGYSHLVFFKINVSKLTVSCLKSTRFFICGNSYNYVKQTASKIRSYKKPEPYKGKGILNKNESINLKEGKKI